MTACNEETKAFHAFSARHPVRKKERVTVSADKIRRTFTLVEEIKAYATYVPLDTNLSMLIDTIVRMTRRFVCGAHR